MVVAAAGRFELVALCYVSGCSKIASVSTNGGPMCGGCDRRRRYANEYGALVNEAMYRQFHTVESAHEWARDEMWRRHGAAWL